jgi:hypothetical protein
MTISGELTEQVRQRAGFACEYCGVSETDTGGLMTVDHFQPRARGGSDDLGNLLNCCFRCNLYKADYWPSEPNDPVLWNPRHVPISSHVLTLADGTLYPLSATGAFTVQRLRLNRPPLVAYRCRQQAQSEELRLLARYRDVVHVLAQLEQQYETLLDEHRTLLEEHRALLRALLKGNE